MRYLPFLLAIACGIGDECEIVTIECGDEASKTVYTEAFEDSYWLDGAYICPEGAEEADTSEDTGDTTYPDSCQALSTSSYGVATIAKLQEAGRIGDSDLDDDVFVAWGGCYNSDYGDYITGHVCWHAPTKE